MKLILSLLLIPIMLIPVGLYANTSFDSFDESYEDIKNEVISENFLKNEKRNLIINNIRNKCNNNDTNIGMITCLNGLSNDLFSEINVKIKEPMSMDVKFNDSYIAWQSYVVTQCESISLIAEGGSLAPKLYQECLINLYQNYLNILNEMY